MIQIYTKKNTWKQSTIFTVIYNRKKLTPTNQKIIDATDQNAMIKTTKISILVMLHGIIHVIHK